MHVCMHMLQISVLRNKFLDAHADSTETRPGMCGVHAALCKMSFIAVLKMSLTSLLDLR